MTMADIKQIEVSGTKYNIAGAAIILEDNGTTTDGVWLAKTNQITSLVDGQMFLYKTKTYPKDNGLTTLNITVNGSALGAKNVIGTGYKGADKTLTFFDTNIYLLMLYDGASFQIINSTPSYLCNVSKILSKNYDNTASPRIEFFNSTIDIKLGNSDNNELIISNDGYHFGFGNSCGYFDIVGYDTSDGHHLVLQDDTDSDKLEIYTTKIYAKKMMIETYYNHKFSRLHIGDGCTTKIYNHDGSSIRFDGAGYGPKMEFYENEYGSCTTTFDRDRIMFNTDYSAIYAIRTDTNSLRFNMDNNANGTKIFISKDSRSTASQNLQMMFINSTGYTDGKMKDGLYINRPINLADPNNNAKSAPSSISYNATDDCIDFKFE